MPLTLEQEEYVHGVTDGVRMTLGALRAARTLSAARAAATELLLNSTEVSANSAGARYRLFELRQKRK